MAQTIAIHGFDPEGEPTITIADDGTLAIRFELMPPSWVEDEDAPDGLGPFARFDQELAAAIGTDVVWEDREVFLVRAPRVDTIQRIQTFLKARGRR